MNEKDDTDIIVEELFDRVEKEGVATAFVSDGRIFVFSISMLERLISDAKTNNSERVVVFVKDPSKASS